MVDDKRESQFRRWLIEHGGAVLKVSRAYAATVEDCQDLVQEILLQVWRSLPRFNGRCAESTWVYRVALNTAIEWRRKDRRRPSGQPAFEVEDRSAEGAEAARKAEQREAIERLYAAIRRLPRIDAALVLLYLDDFSYREIAEVLGISESNVGVKLNRAKKALAELLEDPREP